MARYTQRIVCLVVNTSNDKVEIMKLNNNEITLNNINYN